MNKNNSEESYPLEIIPADAVSEVIASATALVIDIPGNESMAGKLQKMYTHSNPKVYYTSPGVNRLDKTVELAHQLGIVTILLCGQKSPSLKSIFSGKSYSAALISPGNSYKTGETMPDKLLNDSNLTDFAHVGFQIYRHNPLHLRTIRERNFEELRLGALRSNFSESEPMIRDKEYIFIDLNSIRSSDFPYNRLNSPNGLYAEEMCQLARYIGMGQRVKSICLYGYPPSSKEDPLSFEMVAEVIWHIIEALASSLKEDPNSKDTEELFHKKIVNMGDEGLEIIFTTSSSSGRWWMELEEIKSGKKHHVPCSYSDYTIACSGEIPLRWLYYFQKINHN